MEKPLFNKVAGNFAADLDFVKLSEEAQVLLDNAYVGIPNSEVWDYHVYMLGIGTEDTGCWVNPMVRSWMHPADHLQYDIFINSSGIRDLERADQQYQERIITLVRNFPKTPKMCILALDKCYNPDGNVNEANTKFYVPNEYVVGLSKTYPELFIPCISVHPYRPDALEELEKWAKEGVKMLKWMPSVMGIDASHSKCDAFYDKMKTYGMVLLTHTGKEDIMPVIEYLPVAFPAAVRSWRKGNYGALRQFGPKSGSG